MNIDLAKVVESLNLSPTAGSKLTQILRRTVDGTEEVILNPIANEFTPDTILAGWSEIFSRNTSKMNEPLIVLEKDVNASKFGARSIAEPWSVRKANLLGSFIKEQGIPDLKIFALGASRLRPLNISNAINFLKSGTNSGLPDIEKKVLIKPTLFSENLESLRSMVFEACILFTRTQEKRKTRNVWGYSVYLTLYEMMFYRPLLELQAKQSWRSALVSPEAVALGMTRLINQARQSDLKLLSIDFSLYDNTVKKKLQAYAFEMIALCFQPQFRFDVYRIRNIFNTIGVVTPEGILSGPHGIPSGSTFTNEVGSIIQFLIASQFSSGIEFVTLSQVQGDDGVYLVRVASTVMDFFRSFGLIVNDEKSYVATNWAVYLQSLYHSDYVDEKGIINGIYPTYRALNRIIYPERFEDFSKYEISGPDYFAIRTITILENCKYHPLFREFVSYVVKLDKYSLEFSDQGLAAFVKRTADKEGKDVTFKEWTYGSDVKGIKSFVTYKLLQELRV